MKKILYLLIGLALGFALGSPAAQAIEGILAQRCTSPILLNGAPVEIEAYNINGHNYFKLRDIGKAVGFNVYWKSEDGTVQIETNRPYTGEAPAKVETDKPVSQPEVTAPAADVDAMKQDCKYIGENIHRIADWALQDKTVSEVAVWSWNRSAGHQDNLLDKTYAEIGVGLARGVNDDGYECWYCVQLFLRDGYTIAQVDSPSDKME